MKWVILSLLSVAAFASASAARPTLAPLPEGGPDIVKNIGRWNLVVYDDQNKNGPFVDLMQRSFPNDYVSWIEVSWSRRFLKENYLVAMKISDCHGSGKNFSKYFEMPLKSVSSSARKATAKQVSSDISSWVSEASATCSKANIKSLFEISRLYEAFMEFAKHVDTRSKSNGAN